MAFGKFFLMAAASILAAACSGENGEGAAPAPPETPRGEIQEELYGITVADPYRWLEDIESERARAWARAQDGYARARLEADAALLAEIRERVAAEANSHDMGVPLRRGDHLYYMLAAGAFPNPVLARKNLETGATEVVIDPGEGFVVRDFRPDPGGGTLAYALQDKASGETVWRFRDLASGEERRADLPRAHINGDPWLADGKGFVFYRPPDADAGAPGDILAAGPAGEGPPRVLYRHAENPQARVVPDLAGGGRTLVVSVFERSNTNRIFVQRLADGGAPRELFAGREGRYSYLGSRDGVLYFLTTAGSPNGRVIAADLDGDGASAPFTVIPEGEAVMSQAYYFGGRFLAVYLKGGFEVIRLYSREGAVEATLEPPKGLIWNDYPANWPPFSGAGNSAYFRSIALIGAGVYEIDLAAGTMERIFARGAPGPEGGYRIRQVAYPSRGGAEVPMTLVYKAGLDLAQQPPVLINVYGAYGFTFVPFFNPMVRVFIDAGGVYAVPAIRGGGIKGQGWYEAGRGANKINSVEDTAFAAQWLVENGVAEPARLAVMGNSAGSVPAAAAALTRPELFGALLLEVPLADMVRYRLWTGSWNTEFPAPDSAAGVAAALAVSPYHLADAARAVPQAMITAGDRDRSARVSHAYKLTAALQNARTEGPQPLLHVDWGTGHGANKTTAQRIDTWSYELAFLFRALGMEIGAGEGPE